ncbi:hypothetical protein ABK040_002607 [Willaertia magna]
MIEKQSLSVIVESLFHSNSSQISIGEHTKIRFHRTLRIPNDSKTHLLPPSLGTFPIKKVTDYKDKVPKHWLQQGGVFIPMYQREAMWIEFQHGSSMNGKERKYYKEDYLNDAIPRAVQVFAGMINCVSGEEYKEKDLKNKPSLQNYFTIPEQLWLDGISNGDGTIRQFISMPLGKGVTVEEQVTGKDNFGELQIVVYEGKQDVWNKFIDNLPEKPYSNGLPSPSDDTYATLEVRTLTGKSIKIPCCLNELVGTFKHRIQDKEGIPPVQQLLIFAGKQLEDGFPLSYYYINDGCSLRLELTLKGGGDPLDSQRQQGLVVGGSMKQKIYEDPYGLSFFDTNISGRVFVHIVNSEMWKEITGEPCPTTPIFVETYSMYNFPWYDVYDENVPTVGESKVLTNAASFEDEDNVFDCNK